MHKHCTENVTSLRPNKTQPNFSFTDIEEEMSSGLTFLCSLARKANVWATDKVVFRGGLFRQQKVNHREKLTSNKEKVSTIPGCTAGLLHLGFSPYFQYICNGLSLSFFVKVLAGC